MSRPPLQHLRILSARPTVAAWLIVALCFAQSVGFVHGIAHAGADRSGPPVASTADGAAWTTGKTVSGQTLAGLHSCAAFDAAALGATAPSLPSTLVDSCEATASLVPSDSLRTLPDTRLVYRSRAPPTTLA